MYLVIKPQYPDDSLAYSVQWGSKTKQIKQMQGLGLRHQNVLYVAQGTSPTVCLLVPEPTNNPWAWQGTVLPSAAPAIANALLMPKGFPMLSGMPGTDTTAVPFRLLVGPTDAPDTLKGFFRLDTNANGRYGTFTPDPGSPYPPFRALLMPAALGGMVLVWNQPQPGQPASAANPALSLATYLFYPDTAQSNRLCIKGTEMQYGDTAPTQVAYCRGQ